MKHYILRFFLIFACVSLPLHSFACWDDDWDDYYSYDDYDDDWWDYDDDWWWDDDDDDWWNDDVDYGDIGNDDYDIDGGELDDVVVTPDDDWGLDDDWWRVDYSYEEEDNDDDDWYYNYDDDVIIVGYGKGAQDNDKDNEIDPKERQYLVQDCQLCCVPAVMAIMNMYAKKLTIEQAESLQNKYIEKFYEMTGKNVSDIGVSSDKIETFMNLCGFIINHCSVDAISRCTDAGYQVFVFIDVIDNGKTYGHALDIIDSNKDSNGNIVSYECINPNTGNVETHSADEFKHPKNIYCVKEIKECN